MSTTRYASVLGLGFGDCGKGHFVDALARRWRAHTVVRFNGGAQAGHNVVTVPGENSPARHHTFSQFGAGTMVPGVRTVLVDPVIVHPTALLVEAGALGRVGITDALARLTIDEQCRVTTPFHQAAGRLRERLRGPGAHGTCGAGVGETVRHALENSGQALRYRDLVPSAGFKVLIDQLQGIRETLLAELKPRCPAFGAGEAGDELGILEDESLAATWLTQARALARHCPPASWDDIGARLSEPGCVLFEGAQGMLLDEWRGFHPHTTWSSVTTGAVESVLARFAVTPPVEHYGVMRSYLTRHGAGPFPTHDELLDPLLPEPHNSGNGWQGLFRRGHPDGVLLRYAIEVAGKLSGLLVSHLDVFERGVPLNWCASYAPRAAMQDGDAAIERLPLGAGQDLCHQIALTRLLQKVRPNYDSAPIRTAPDFLAHVVGVTSVPVILGSFGPTCADVRELQ